MTAASDRRGPLLSPRRKMMMKIMMKKKMEMDQNEAEIKFHRVKKHA